MRPAVAEPPPRVLGRRRGGPGATVIACAGLHGNEPAGLEAARRVLDGLEGVPLRGEFLAVAGNRGALAAGMRFLGRDLNRCWTAAEVEALRARPGAADEFEQAEQRELLGVLGEAEPPIVLFDLHTTSGASPPFVLMSDTLRNRPIAFGLGLPVVLGL